MKHCFYKYRLTHTTTGLPTNVSKSSDQIIVDFSNHTVKEILKGEEQENLWPYNEVTKTHIDGIYKLSVPNKGYWSDWNFKPKGLKEKTYVFYYIYRDNIVKFIRGIMSLVG